MADERSRSRSRAVRAGKTAAVSGAEAAGRATGGTEGQIAKPTLEATRPKYQQGEGNEKESMGAYGARLRKWRADQAGGRQTSRAAGQGRALRAKKKR